MTLRTFKVEHYIIGDFCETVVIAESIEEVIVILREKHKFNEFDIIDVKSIVEQREKGVVCYSEK